MRKFAVKTKRAIFRTALLVLAALVIGFGIYNFNAKTLVGDKLPMPFGIGLSVVLTGSMEPSLSEGDLVVVRRTDELREGQIIVYQEDGLLVIHRIKRLGEETVITQGDANNTEDDPIPRSAVKGELLFRIPGIGRAFQLLRHPAVMLSLLALALLLTEISFRRGRSEDREDLGRIREEIEALSRELGEEAAPREDTTE